MLCVTHSLIVILWKMKYNGYLATGPFIAYSGGITLDTSVCLGNHWRACSQKRATKTTRNPNAIRDTPNGHA